jgi:hypothetical protein
MNEVAPHAVGAAPEPWPIIPTLSEEEAEMPDDSRLPPGATLCLTLLTGRLTNHLHAIERPAATGCGACHRPWKKHRRKQRGLVMSCERCGIEFYDTCYFQRITTSRERVLFWAEGGERGYLFLCAGCRS